MFKTIMMKGLSIQEISAFLTERGFTVGSNKPSDYLSRGLMLQGMRNIDNGGTKAYKVYYNPIVLVEFMSASLLKKGNWLNQDSRQTHTKLTDQDVFCGRLGAYYEIIRQPQLYSFFFKAVDEMTGLPLCRFFLDVSYWYPQIYSGSPSRIILMDGPSVSSELACCQRFLKDKYLTEEAVSAYLEWAKWQYFLTFKSVFEHNIADICNMQLTAIRTKVDEIKITEFHKHSPKLPID